MAQPGEIQKLQDGLTALEGMRAGYSIAAAIHEQGTAARFGQTGEDVIAYFDPVRNEIVVNEELRGTTQRSGSTSSPRGHAHAMESAQFH